jgi:uracil-DNA glycosylase family 4
MENSDRHRALNVINAEVQACTSCSLYKTRTNTVFGEGNLQAKVVFCGEAPGQTEDETGRPFVGRAGKLLDNMIKSMDLERDDVYILNVCKCRPPGNRTPSPDEMGKCIPYLFRQVQIIQPDVIVALGNTALSGLTLRSSGITKRCGNWEFFSYTQGTAERFIKLMPCYHPSALLRNPKWKDPAWYALEKVAKEMAEPTFDARDLVETA